ncbi:MAG: hypothetical protein U5L08_15635 [Xanthomonadales bacterium]|nr:hypothetical protein [Xanthomonadales bacterium]
MHPKTSLRVLTLTLALTLLAAPAFAATHWVGSSAACTGSNVHGSLGAALLAAAFNGTQSDEIRLTNTISYAGSGGKVTLTDWSPSSAGSLTIAGGYSNCFTSPSGRTNFGNTTGTAVTVETSSQPESNVTLRRLNIRSADTGLSATGGALVILDNVRIGDHDTRGILVDGGAYVDIQANSIVEDNGERYSGTGWGGGVYCNGNNSEVTLRGRLHRNSADKGGNAYLVNGCYMMAMGGSIISSAGIASPGANDGGGVYIDNGGEFYANGGSQRVTFTGNFANNGAGIYVKGTGQATLVNTFLQNNAAYVGAAIYAIGGGTGGTPQLTMDRASSCPFQISCSEMEANRTESSVVYVDNSYVRINRTLVETTWTWTIIPDFQSIFHGTNGALIRLGHVGMYNNTATDAAIWNEGAQFEILHATIARNVAYVDSGTPPPSAAILSQGSGSATYLHNSIIANSTGVDLQGGSIQSECNLADSDPGDLPGGTYYIATPQFINLAGGDARQTSASPGVDMCQQNPLLWSSTLDIERQSTGVNDANNNQGNPGQSGGYYDAGFDENHMNVGDDHFTLTAARAGTGSGNVISVPLGISCGSDCNEDFFNGTLVELHAVASSGSTFNTWSLNCPLPSGNICYISVTTDTTITANFASGPTEDKIFSDRFETAP